MTLERRVLQLSKPQSEWLDREAERLGISSAELLRRIVDWYRDLAEAQVETTDGAGE